MEMSTAMADRSTNDARVEQPSGVFDEALEQIRQSLLGLRFGTISIIVQDGVVIQLERTERRRLRRAERN
jgi:hypothetical protein